jgi:hypothetical protein
MQFYWLVLGILGVWRVTHLIHAEDGPVDALLRLRQAVRRNFVGRALGCFYCLSLWTALPMACLLGQSWGERTLLWFALSAGAILLERVTESSTVRAHYLEDPLEMTDDQDVQLRQKHPVQQ